MQQKTEREISHRRCRAGVWMKLSFGISVNSDLTKDLVGEKKTLFNPRSKTEQLLQSVPLICAAADSSVNKFSVKHSSCNKWQNSTHSDMTSGGKVRGMSPALSQSALSLVHVHDEGQRGCLALLLSTTRQTDANTRKANHGSLLGILRVFPILANRRGHDLRLEQRYT